jgi:hypothetical protein
MDDAILVYEALTAVVLAALTIVLLVLFEIRAQGREREELNRLLITALFRMSKDQIKALEDQTRHADALGVALLRALRQGNASPALLAEIRREIESARPLAQRDDLQPPELPPGKTDKLDQDE